MLTMASVEHSGAITCLSMVAVLSSLEMERLVLVAAGVPGLEVVSRCFRVVCVMEDMETKF